MHVETNVTMDAPCRRHRAVLAVVHLEASFVWGVAMQALYRCSVFGSVRAVRMSYGEERAAAVQSDCVCSLCATVMTDQTWGVLCVGCSSTNTKV